MVLHIYSCLCQRLDSLVAPCAASNRILLGTFNYTTYDDIYVTHDRGIVKKERKQAEAEKGKSRPAKADRDTMFQ
jgi:hypothetical protein